MRYMDENFNPIENKESNQSILNNDQNKRSTLEHKPPKKKRTFITGLVLGILVSLVIWFIWDDKEITQSETSPSAAEALQSDRVSVEVTTDVTGIVEKVADSVVGVTNLKLVRDIWSSSQMTKETGSGSGVIYKEQGDKAYIVTNHHVVEDAEELEITFDDGKKASGRLVGSDIWTDLAVIEIDATEVKAIAKFGDSDALKRGEAVIAIGNPLGLGFSGSVTVGVISGKDRSIPIDFNNDNIVDWYADVLQTDAAINPGNSGGALMNLTGQLIGINSMKISQETVEGIGLAIPINLAIPIIEKLEKFGEVHRPTMGVTLLDLSSIPGQQQRSILKIPDSVTEGVVINEVIQNSPASLAGIVQYDVIVEMDGEKIGDMVSLRKHLYNEKEIGDLLKMKVYRGSQLLEIEMVLKDGTAF
ncbi:S1C family serine protease [Sporosarcina siberiensis]|uniref:S1C family serine protease n=1 Tax=Sporosarcina siberiensis TaxID=1365606 RepID=A0ABW4SFV4_9BACL